MLEQAMMKDIRTAARLAPLAGMPAGNWLTPASRLLARWKARCAAARRRPDPMHGSEERFQALARLSADWYWETDASHCIVGVVPAPNRAHKVGEAGLGATRWDTPGARVNSGDWHAHRDALERREVFRDFCMSQRGIDGRMRHSLVNGEPVFDRKGNFCGYRGVGHDITAQRETERALNASESQLAAIIDSAMDAIITVDASHRVVLFNGFAGALFGCPRSRALGVPLVRFMPQAREALHEAAAQHDACRSSGGIARVRARLVKAVRSDGLAFEAEASISRIEVNGREFHSIILREAGAGMAAS
jgi:PAS domain S-box-containing protein